MKSLDRRNSRQLSADDFSGALAMTGLKFGHAVVDRVMLLCSIGEGGEVSKWW